MSYDIYLWHQAAGDVDELLDALAEDDSRAFTPHESVAAFRRQLLDALPHLGDVVDPPVSAGSDEHLRYLVLTLPFSWLDVMPQVLALAHAHGLSGWDPQADAAIGSSPPAHSGTLRHRDLRGPWTLEHLKDMGVGVKALSRAWSFVALPEQVTFGQAVGVFLLAMALRDGAEVTQADAVRVVAEVASQCADGIPTRSYHAQIGFTITDVTGFAQAVAVGHY